MSQYDYIAKYLFSLLTLFEQYLYALHSNYFCQVNSIISATWYQFIL